MSPKARRTGSRLSDEGHSWIALSKGLVGVFKLKEILHGVSVEVNEATYLLSRLPDVVNEWPIVLRQSMYTSEFNPKLLCQSTII